MTQKCNQISKNALLNLVQKQLSNGFNRVHDELLNHHNQIHLEMEDKVVQINDAIEQIASLNQQILNTDDNGLKDSRALLIDELSEIVNINVAETASGGELSRFLLALKTVFSHVSGFKTLVFDEIDSGVSGRISTSIAKLLKEIS